MILVDLSQTMMATIFENIKHGLSKPLAKSMIYVTLLSYKKKFGGKFGGMVLCADSRVGYWRKDVFEHYKAHRKKSRDASDLDWELIFEIMNEVRAELEECCPWKFVCVDKAEADDVIAILAMKYGNHQPTLIMSTDKDYKQLHYLSQVEHYSPTKKKFITTKDPEGELKELILCGDAGDGIPNLLSDADTFVTEGKRQKPITKKIREEFMTDPSRIYKAHSERYDENKKLIDFNEIPVYIQEAIVSAFDSEIKGSINKLYKLFVANRMNRLLSDIELFKVKESDYGIHPKGGFFE